MSRCTNLRGTWVDPYGAGRYDLATDMDIDHVVPLAEAHRTGGRSWSTARRTKYANDPLVLLAVDDALNQSKSDKGPEAWAPPNTSSRCNYAIRWIWIKYAYRLTTTQSEKSALWRMLDSC